MNDKCHFCGNKNFVNRKVQYIYKRENKFLLVNDVPCEVCEFCGEQYFEAKVLKRIEKDFNEIHFKGKKVKNELTLPVEEFEEIPM